MENAITVEARNDNQASKLQKREVFKLADFEKISLSDVHNMFGAWKEADHCDKDIQG